MEIMLTSLDENGLSTVGSVVKKAQQVIGTIGGLNLKSTKLNEKPRTSRYRKSRFRRRIVLSSTKASCLHTAWRARDSFSAADRIIVCGPNPSPQFVTRLLASCRVQSPDRITFLDSNIAGSKNDIVRLVRLMVQGNANELIFDVRMPSDVLYAVSANFEQLELPLTKLQEFRPGTNRAQWSKFEVDRLGGLFV